MNRPWLGLIAGNSRLHWGAFADGGWLGGWATPHLSPAQAEALMVAHFTSAAWTNLDISEGTPHSPCPPLSEPLPLVVATVVPAQGALWHRYHSYWPVTLAQVSLANLYPTLGIDRALALVGARTVHGWPALVIDGGTALTLTAGTGPPHAPRLLGGAILPGLGLQLRSLHQHTAALPTLTLPTDWPPRWATDTATAIHSGIAHTVIAGLAEFVSDWRQHHPTGVVVCTGGNGPWLAEALNQNQPQDEPAVQADPHLGHWGLQVCWERAETPSRDEPNVSSG